MKQGPAAEPRRLRAGCLETATVGTESPRADAPAQTSGLDHPCLCLVKRHGPVPASSLTIPRNGIIALSIAQPERRESLVALPMRAARTPFISRKKTGPRTLRDQNVIRWALSMVRDLLYSARCIADHDSKLLQHNFGTAPHWHSTKQGTGIREDAPESPPST